jgi:hypothetical protein
MDGTSKYWVIGIGVVLVIVAFFVFSHDKESAMVPTVSPSPSARVSPSRAPSSSVTPQVSAEINIDYNEAVVQYAGHRIQFDKYCQAVPNKLTLKNGTSIMLDNRSGDARMIAINGKTYSLAGYGFKIVSLSSSTLPATLPFDCGSARNVGQISLQQ